MQFRKDLIRTFSENWFFILVYIGLIVFPHAVGWLTDSSPFGMQRGARVIMTGRSAFWMSVMIEIFSLAILVMSYNLMFGFTGVISFGHALFFGLGGYLVGLMWEYTDIEANLGLALSIAATLLLCGTIGLLIGLVSLRLRGVYFAIFTLAIAEMAFIYVGRWALTNGEDGFAISNLPEWLDPTQRRLNLYYAGMILFALTFWIIRRLVKSPAGSVFQAIRENEERAQAIGYNTLRYKLLAITVAGMMAGMAGLLHATLNKKIGPEMFGVAYTVDALLMTIIGGIGTFLGPVLGASGLHLADTVFRDAEITIGETVINVGDSWTLLLGFIFILAVIVFPFGIVGTWARIRNRFRREDTVANPEPEAHNTPIQETT